MTVRRARFAARAARPPKPALARAGGPQPGGGTARPGVAALNEFTGRLDFLLFSTAIGGHAAPIVTSVEDLRDVRHSTELRGKEALG